MKRIVLLAIILLAAANGWARTWEFDVWFFNYRDKAVVFEIKQYNSPKFTYEIPSEFTNKESGGPHEYQRIEVGPHESRKVSFSDAGGGYWVRWRVDTPCKEWPEGGTIDLLKDSKVVTVYQYTDCPAAP